MEQPNIKKLREEQGISQAELARLSNVSRKQIHSIEKGENTTFKTIAKLLSVLNTNTADIL